MSLPLMVVFVRPHSPLHGGQQCEIAVEMIEISA